MSATLQLKLFEDIPLEKLEVTVNDWLNKNCRKIDRVFSIEHTYILTSNLVHIFLWWEEDQDLDDCDKDYME